MMIEKIGGAAMLEQMAEEALNVIILGVLTYLINDDIKVPDTLAVIKRTCQNEQKDK